MATTRERTRERTREKAMREGGELLIPVGLILKTRTVSFAEGASLAEIANAGWSGERSEGHCAWYMPSSYDVIVIVVIATAQFVSIK